MSTRQVTSNRTRLLLLLGLATAGTTAAILATADSAHAADRHPAVLEQPATIATRTLGNPTLRISRPPATRTAPPHTTRPAADTTRHTRRAATEAHQRAREHTKDTVRRTTRPVKHTTDTLDKVAAPLPALGTVVDDTTDITDKVIDRVTATTGTIVDTPPLTLPLPRLLGAPPATPTTGAAPQTAPEPTPEHPPLFAVTGSGAAHLAPTQTHRDTAAHTANSGLWHQLAPAPNPTGPGQWNGCDTHPTAVAPTADHQQCTPAGAWTHPARWQQHITKYIGDRDSRTHSPNPPPG